MLLTNVMFSVSHVLQSDEIDLVAIGPPGVRIIEVKHWNPQWVKYNGLTVEAEADRVSMKDAGLARRCGGGCPVCRRWTLSSW